MIYLDYNATTPCAPEVLDAMLPYFRTDFANASSTHAMGRKAAVAVAGARSHVATAIECSPEEVYFTSGATESNNMVLLGATSTVATGKRIVVSAIEHKSVLEPCAALSTKGLEVVRLPVTRSCVVDVQAAEQLIDDDTFLVSVQGANNEVGTVQSVKAIASIAHRHGALVHCDATQLLGKMPVSVTDLQVDFASFSGHKAYGPKGIGALFIRRGAARSVIRPLAFGGGHESEIRPGTSNVSAIVGFGEACRIAVASLETDMSRIRSLRDYLERQLMQRASDATTLGAVAERLPGTLGICFSEVPADALIASTPCVCVGTGAACIAGAASPSHVLLACGYSRDIARCFVRISLGRYTTSEEVDCAIESLTASVRLIRNHTPRQADSLQLTYKDDGR